MSTPSLDRTPAGLRDPASYVAELESLRGWAIVLVVFYHLDSFVLADGADFTGNPSIPGPLAYLRAGHSGVTLFFVLSAFLLARPFLRGGLPGLDTLRHFYARRALRILPLYYTAVLIAVGLTAERAGDWLRAVPYAFFLQSWPPLVTTLMPHSGVWWSLATEIQFYLVLPLLPCLLYTRLGRIAGGLLALGYAVFYAAWTEGALALWPRDWDLPLQLSLLGRGPAFAAGIAAAALHERFGVRLRRAAAARPLLARGGGDLALLGLLLALGFLLLRVARMGFYPAEAHWPGWHALEALLWAAILLALLWLPLALQRAFVNPLLGQIGTLSYSLYLIHFPVIALVVLQLRMRGWIEPAGWTPGSAAAGLLVVALCGTLAVLSYRWIERPFLDRKSRLV
jgi:peptidoglycan/LPS O-acetylase OafA/YrhL